MKALLDELLQLNDKELAAAMEHLSHHKLKRLGVAKTAACRKYKKSKKARYGRLPRALNPDQLRTFFGAIRNPNIKIAFLIQFFYGLRISEIKTVQVHWEQELIKIRNAKCGRDDWLPLYEPTKELFRHIDDIRGYSTNYLQKCFRAIRRDCGDKLTLIYGVTEGGITRNLHLWTPHSLRHSAVGLFGDYISDLYKLTMFSRHDPESKIGVVAVYRQYDFDQLRKDLEDCFCIYTDLLCWKRT